jgi:3-deoxy-manno-octulosonate cytidylyltransferase (CMP-KDO synthetase)
MNIIAIPARLHSTRCHHKLIRKVAGRPLIEHTILAALQSDLADRILVLSEDQEILDAITLRHHKLASILTAKSDSGTNRIVSTLTDEIHENDVVVNWQGDEPFFQPNHVDMAIDHIKSKRRVAVETFISEAKHCDLDNVNVVKVVLNSRNEAIYFSRLNVPYKAEKAFIHHGIYVFRGSTLFDLQTINPLHNVSESLEQLRWIENDMVVHCHLINAAKSGIDVDDDFMKFEQATQR